MRDVEYDRFGPWILEISETDTVPRVFKSYVDGQKDYLLCAKIPRPVERRDLKPGDNMYDYLVTLFEDRIEILVRDGDDASRFSLGYSEIVALRHTEDLLDGHLVIYASEITYDLPYSTVSVDIAQKMAGIIREKYASPVSRSEGNPSGLGDEENLEELSFLFTSLVNARSAKDDGAVLFGIQNEKKMKNLDQRLLHKFFYGTVDMRLLESIHYMDERELEIINRGKPWVYRWQVNYCKETLYIPLDRLKSVDENDRTGTQGISDLTLSTAVSNHDFFFTHDNSAMERYRTIVLG